MNKLTSIILSVALLIISSHIPEAKQQAAEVEIEKTLPVTMGMIEPLELIEIEEESVEVIEEDPVKEVVKESKPDNGYLGNFKITYYCGCTSCSDDWGTMTATGVTAKEGRTIAVDPRVISYGTRVVINGHEYVAEDCGGAIKGNRIDIFVNDHERARQAGVDYHDVYLASYGG